MMEKYSLLPINPQQLTPVQTALQRMSEKHPDFEIPAVNTIRPPDIEYTQKSKMENYHLAVKCQIVFMLKHLIMLQITTFYLGYMKR